MNIFIFIKQKYIIINYLSQIVLLFRKKSKKSTKKHLLFTFSDLTGINQLNSETVIKNRCINLIKGAMHRNNRV